MRAWRVVLAVCGVLVGLFGAVQLIVGTPWTNLLILAGWMIGAVLIHDGVIAPVVVSVGWGIGRVVPARARRYLQVFLIAGGLVSAIAIPLIARRGTQEASKAILQQDYGTNLSVLLGLFAGVSLLAYAAHVARDRLSAQQPDTGAK